ncbi:hypothetical protein SAMN06297144_0460 [Sphingomonas guangdongensis]|uniref:Peptidase propeptide and YPEB domain-containing protein n=1 Tax=Sphingomonas guangdongensis TaxID=1141890 RepID=A0A285QBE1_9SPHN|nr:hypothetical protein [Sphingomonas guangdongensis]SOB79265.1 hypothetical protein SAMN06297144_0460 [Sphingomonas guangdongensis]
MTMISAVFLLLGAPPVPLAALLPVSQHRRGDHDDALHARKQGRLLPVGEIERRIVPQMRGARYIGFDFDAGSAVYTLKFLREGHVIWVSVDGRSGTVIGRAGG